MGELENRYSKFEKYKLEHNCDITSKCENKTCIKNGQQDNCFFHKLLLIENNISLIQCPHKLIDVLIKYCNLEKSIYQK